MIELLKKGEHGVDNGVDSCRSCIWYVECEHSPFPTNGCSHPILYDKDGDIISEVDDEIIRCMYEPRYCCLMEKKH